MPATVNLLPRKCFEIALEDGTIIKGQFGTWALKRFCDKGGLTLGEAEEKLRGISGIIDYILCAVEYVSRQNKESFSYTDMNVCQWVDDIGGHNSEAFLKLIGHTVDENNTEDVGEKKTET